MRLRDARREHYGGDRISLDLRNITHRLSGLGRSDRSARGGNVYKKGARDRKFEFLLSREEFRILTSSNCYFCGVEPKQKTGRIKYTQTYGEYLYNGIDRKDNAQGYTVENCLPCCKICNYAKHKISFEEFEAWLNRIVEFRKYNHIET